MADARDVWARARRQVAALAMAVAMVLGMAGGSLTVAASPAGAATNGTISGTVTLSGKPAATASGVCIAIFTAGGFESSVAGTGATGTFSVQGFSPTTSYVVLAHTAPLTVRGTSITCSKSPYFAARFSGDTSTLTSATSVKGQSTGLHITLPAAGAISGTAKNTTGVPLQGVCVTANTTSFHSFVSTATPSTGDYSFEGLTPGAYTVRFTTATCPSAPTGTGYVGKTVSLTVVASTTQTYTATLTLAGGLEGKVTNSSRVGIATVCVYASEVTGTSFFGGPTATTNATGNFTLKGLIATKQYVVEYSTIQCNSTSQNYVPQFAKDKATITQATKIQLQAGTFTNGVTATLVAGGAISGTVKNTAGAALATVCVSANPISSGAPAANAQTSSTGTYTLEGLATGTYMAAHRG
nr:carboxypeptidase-like regulatory domain-containing protein [Actinomycetota bacterium]